MATLDRLDPLTMVYDGDCGVCEAMASWVVRRAPHVLAVSSGQFIKQTQHPDPAHFNRELLMLDGDGNEFWGPEAALMCLRESGHPVLGWQGWTPVWRVLYPVIARNRSRISRVLGLRSECRLEPGPKVQA
jgi:predicted DCC family thiol-disulfide oxidoreductase YuxK